MRLKGRIFFAEILFFLLNLWFIPLSIKLKEALFGSVVMNRVVLLYTAFTEGSFRLCRVLLCCVCATLFSLRAHAQENAPAAQSSAPVLTHDFNYKVRVYFPFDKSGMYPDYMSNPTALDSLERASDFLISGNGVLELHAFSSPEGNYWYNSRLSARRAKTVHDFLVKVHPDLEGHIKDLPVPECWEGFRAAISSDRRISESVRSRMLAIIDSGAAPDVKESRIKEFPEYGHFYRNYFKSLRYVELELVQRDAIPMLPVLPAVKADADFVPKPMKVKEPVYVPVLPLADTVEMEETLVPVDSVAPSAEITVPELSLKARKTILALKTNLLYDAVTALNFELEFPIGDRFSIAVEDVFPWWTWGPHGNKYAFEMWEMGVEPRWWFKKSDSRDRLAGHFAGVYAMSAKYDFQWDYEACYQGEYWSAGLTYGFAKPICKWLNMEFSASVGYLRGPYRHYFPSEDYEVLWRDRYVTGTFNYFGLTKAKISLVIPITYKYNVRAKK